MAKRKKKKKRRLPKLFTGFAGLLASEGIRSWMHTLDCRVAYYDHKVDPIFGVGGPRLYVFWHEYILMPLYTRGHNNLSMLLSQHEDAEVLSRVAYHLGFGCVRGSSYRGGARAVLELTKRSRTQHLTITPDGPRGPRRRMALGPIYLASRLQMPLVPMGFGYDRPWRANSWDRFAVPRPFSRARAILGPPLTLPRRLDRDGMERCRERIEQLLNALTSEAETWAEAGTRKAGERVWAPQAAPPLAEWHEAQNVRSRLRAA